MLSWPCIGEPRYTLCCMSECRYEYPRFGYCVPDAGTYVPESGTPLPFPNLFDVLLAQICVRKVTALATRSAKRGSLKSKP